MAATHWYQPLAFWATVHAGGTQSAGAGLGMGQAGPCHFHQPARSGEGVGELSQAMHSFRAALVEHPYGHQGHAGPRVVESKIEAAAGQVAQGAALHVHFHSARIKVSNGEALVCSHRGYLGRRWREEGCDITEMIHTTINEGLITILGRY